MCWVSGRKSLPSRWARSGSSRIRGPERHRVPPRHQGHWRFARPLGRAPKGRPLGHACADPVGLVVQGRMLVFLGHVERSTVDDRPRLIRPRQPQPVTLEGAQEKRLEPILNCDVTTRSSGGSSPWRMRTIWRGMGLSIRTQAEIGAVRLWFGKRKSGA